MKQYEVNLYFCSNASVVVEAESKNEALELARKMDLSKQIQDGLSEEDNNVIGCYDVPNGVIINDGTKSEQDIESLEKRGCLVLSIKDKIEYEDCETGEFKELTIEKINDDFMLCDEYDENGKIISEIELPYYTYLYQLEECGALDDYPSVDMEKYKKIVWD